MFPDPLFRSQTGTNPPTFTTMEALRGTEHRDYWLRQAKSVRTRVNLGWWLETLAAPLVITSLASAAILLWIRRESPVESWLLVSAVSGLVLSLAAVCLALAARRFERIEQSLVRIEAAMMLRNALSAARAGVAPWPAPLGKTHAGLRWQPARLMVPLLGSVALVAAGLWMPIAAGPDRVSHAPEQPQAWQQLAAELDFLSEEEVVDEHYLEETRKRLDELKSREPEQWFSHSSLEASDSLKKSHRAETGRVEHELGMAEKSLAALDNNSASQADRNRRIDEFDQALQGLQNGAMKPNPELLEQLANLDLKNLGNLSPAQLQKLREAIKLNAEKLKQANCDGGECDAALLAVEGEIPGAGGVDRGPGHVPGLLGEETAPLETGDLTPLEAKDLSQAAPGDLLQLQDGEHDIDQSASPLTRGGNTTATGTGGDRVWRESLDPDEQRVMKRFFE